MKLHGASLEQMTTRGEDAARHMRYAIKLVLIALSSDLRSKSPSADDLIKAQTYWERQVDKVLQPDIRSALLFGGDLIHKLLKDDSNDVPRVTNDYAEWYLLTTRNRLSGVGNIVWESARFQLLDGMSRGEDIKTLRQRIRKTLGVTAPRAETIARTEVNGAMNAGSLIQMKSTGLPFTKTWLATPGPRTRRSHSLADGQKVAGDKKFIVGGWPMDRPHDPNAPAEETENCRCTMTFEIKKVYQRKKTQAQEDKALLKALFGGAEMTSSCGCTTAPSDGATVLTTDVSSDGGGTVTLTTIEPVDSGEEFAGKPGGDKGSCADGERWDPIQRKCVPDQGAAEGETEDLGGKPNPGTEKDDRLRKNKIKTRDRKSSGETEDDFAAGGTTQADGFWTGVLAVEGIETGDGREFASGALTWADTPFSLRWNKEDSHGGEPHTVAVNVGRIDHAWRDPEASHMIRGSGMFNLETEDGVRAHQMVRDGFLSGISIDPDNITDADVEYVWADKPEGSEEDDGEDGGDDILKMLFGRPEKVIFHAGRIRAATLVDIPAFVEAKVQLSDGEVLPPLVEEPALTAGAVGVHVTATSDEVWDAAQNDRVLPAQLDLAAAKSAYAYVDDAHVSEGTVAKTACRFIHHEVQSDGVIGPANLTACSAGIGILFGGRGGTNLSETARRGVYAHLAAHLRDAGREPPPYRDETVSASLVAHGGPEWRPPKMWFGDPKLGQLTPIIVTDEGRVYGHAAQWGECHLGIGDSCTMAPRETGHPYFMTGEVVCEDGGRVAVGQIYTRTNHAPLFLNSASATRHYEDTGYVVADVTLGNDHHGIWVAGAVRSDALVTRVNELRASGQVSPDWRRIGGQLRMVGMLVVNVSGYQVPKPRAASHDGQIRSLVSAGVVQVGAASALRAEAEAEADRVRLAQEAFAAEMREMAAIVHGKE